MNTCPYCGDTHSVLCPMIKAIEYFSDGTVKRVEFKVPVNYQSAPQVSIPSVFYPPSFGAQHSIGYTYISDVPSNTQ